MREPMEKMYGDQFKKLWEDWVDTLIDIHNKKVVCVGAIYLFKIIGQYCNHNDMTYLLVNKKKHT